MDFRDSPELVPDVSVKSNLVNLVNSRSKIDFLIVAYLDMARIYWKYSEGLVIFSQYHFNGGARLDYS